ncbi:heavy metal-associated isoprenylated plant protein 16-like [Primulina eburnea]|uniref:heavy metal-associated isoprenylated plant protein 16-like n=1 Tax=Primulina eburnea TaxID=1245227 RepID=UPI003C6BE85A
MKQRIVIEVCMSDFKSRSKALKIAVGLSGVESAAITGPGKNQVELVGDGIDVVVLTKLIRKKVAYADIVSVGDAEKDEAAAQTPPEAVETPPPPVWPFPGAPFDYRYNYWNYANAHDVRGQAPVWPFA